MDKAKGLIRLAPVIYGIDNWVVGYMRDVLMSYLDPLKSEDEVIEDVDGVFGRLRDHRWTMTDEFGSHIPAEDGGGFEDEDEEQKEPLLALAWRLLTHPSIQQIEDGGLAEMRSAVLTMQNSRDKRELTEAARTLVDASYEFNDHFYRRLPDHLLGEWGGKLFRYLMVIDAEEVAILAKSLGSESPPEDLSLDLTVKVDEETFSVQMGNRRPCWLGNSRQFKLLAHLVAQPHRFVSYADLADAIGGDELDREAVIVAKCRLCKRLGMEGYEDLAKMILSQPDHYAFWPG